jgi:2-methylcitrate dehydratase PrpD
LRDKVEMVLDEEVDTAYPQRWIGKVTVHTTDGRVLSGRVDEPKGDPGNTLSREEITAKALRLAAHSGGAGPEEMAAAVAQLWQVMQWPRVQRVLPARA